MTKAVLVIIFLTLLLMLGCVNTNVPTNQQPDKISSKLAGNCSEWQKYSEELNLYWRNSIADVNLACEAAKKRLVGYYDGTYEVQQEQFDERVAAIKKELSFYKLCRDYTYPKCSSYSYTVNLNFDVCTASMRPEFDCSYPFSAFHPRNNYAFKVCDVISFKLPTATNSVDIYGNRVTVPAMTHRIVGINGQKFITKGDAIDVIDKYQPQREDVEWVVCK